MNSIKDYAKRLRAAADMLDELHGKPNPTHKEKLLEHYATGTRMHFTQMDGFVCDGPDDVMNPDENGFSVMGIETYELRHHDIPVRLQILSGTPASVAVALVQKMLNWAKSDATMKGEAAFTLEDKSEFESGFPDDGGVPF